MRERNQLDLSIKSIRSIEHEFHENIELLELGENEGDIVISEGVSKVRNKGKIKIISSAK